jgi:hypothetical protein
MTTLIQNLGEAVQTTVENPLLRNKVERLLQDLNEIETEVLAVSRAREFRKPLRTFIYKGGAALIVDRGKVRCASNPSETTVMVSLETLKRLLLTVIELTDRSHENRRPAADLLVGLDPVPVSEASFTVDVSRAHSAEPRQTATGIKLQ